MIFIIKLYRKFISPIKPNSCRFYPTCSVYALEAYTKYGFFKGSYYTFKRLIKCHPFNKGGIDYLP
ncbi:MAG: membrane protein insertion efficiency factor YidD [Clostridia bacterium]